MYMLLKLRFFFVRHPLHILKKTVRSIKGIGAVKSLCLALAGTLGVGNVLGVCVGIIVGGAGSVFWMLVSVLFASVLKYSEVVISSDNLIHTDEGACGGMFYVIRNSFSHIGGAASKIYAASLVLLSLVMGAGLQSGTVVETTGELFDTPPVVICAVLAFAVLFAIVGGAKIIEKITLVVIPLSTIIYITLTLSVLFMFRERIPDVISLILGEAFEVRSVGGGVLGFLTGGAVKEGFCRGLLSNEAGSGTSSTAHARSGILSPAAAGLMGIVEVVFDTAVLCLLTAFTVLVAVPDYASFDGGMALIMTALGSALGSFSAHALLLCVFAFAFSTVICWYFYGSSATAELFGRRSRLVFLPLYLLFCFSAVLANNSVLIALTDMLMLILTLLSSAAVIKNSDRIRALSECGGVIVLRESRIRENGFLK